MDSVESFGLTWTAMTAVMMAPSVLPFVVAFARRSPRWPLPTLCLVLVYLLVWTTFGIGTYYALRVISPSWPASVGAALAIAFAGAYAFTPLMRLGQARCIAMCRRVEPIGGLGLRPALREGAGYGLSCVACSAGVMIALEVLGMSSVVLMAAGSGLIVLYKVGGRWPRRVDAGLSLAMVFAGIWLAIV